MKCSSMLLNALLFFCQNSSAQITLTRSDWESVFGHGGIELVYTDATTPGPGGTFPVDIGKSGGPNVYDFSTRPFAGADTSLDFLVSQVPSLAARYPTDAIGVRIPGRSAGAFEYVLFRFTDSAFQEVGHAETYPDRQLYRHYDPALTAHPFPTTFGQSWPYTTTARETTYVGGSPTQVSSTAWSQNRSIDGYGILKLPGHTFDCLRLRSAESQANGFKGFQFLTREGVFLEVQTRNSEPDTGMVMAEGVFYFIPASLVSVSDENGSPGSFWLAQNYPNPFNPFTSIRFSLASRARCTLKIFDVLGRDVAVLVDRHLSAGEHRVDWHTAGLASGVYVYRLQAGNFVAARKLAVLK